MAVHAQPPSPVRKSAFHPSDPVAANDLHARDSHPGIAIIDATVLTLLLATTNYFLSRNDPGWLALNPSPWLILPVYLGARHGLIAAISGAWVAITSVLTLYYFSALEFQPLPFLQAQPVFFSGLIFGGVLAGIAHKIVTGRVRRLRATALEVSRENLRLSEEVALFRENEAALQEALLLHGAEYTALTGELSALYEVRDSEVEPRLLELLHQHLGVTASAIFVRENKNRFRLTTSRGSDNTLFRSTIEPAASPMISAAIESGKMVAAGELLAHAPAPEPILAVFPWGENPGETDVVCLIYRMAFDQVNWETLGRIEAVFDWAMARCAFQKDINDTVGSSGNEQVAHQILSPEAFRERIERAKTATETLKIAYRLVVFSPDDPDAISSDDQNRFLNEIRQSLRTGDCLGAVMSLRNDYAIGLLTQSATDRAAELNAKRLRDLSGVRGIGFRVYELSDPELANALGNPGPLTSDQPVEPPRKRRKRRRKSAPANS